MALTKKINEFKKCFGIEDIDVDKNIIFDIDDKNNLYALFNNKRFILTNQRNTNKFLSYNTMKFKKNYGCEFLNKLIPKTDTAKQITAKKDLQEKMISLFKCLNITNSDFDLSAITYVEDNKLYTTNLDNKKVILFSCGKPHVIINRDIKQKLEIPLDLTLTKIYKCFTEDFECNIPNKIPNKEIKNKMQLMNYKEPPFLGDYYTKKYVSFLSDNNISDVFNEDLKIIIEKNADVFQVYSVELILKYEFYSGINDGAEKEMPSIFNIRSEVAYDNYDDFLNKSKLILAKKLEHFVAHNKLEFCDKKLTSSCLSIRYRPQNIPLF